MNKTGISVRVGDRRHEITRRGGRYCVHIYGEPASKANARRLVLMGGKPRFIKSKKAIDYEKSLKAQLVPLPDLMEGPVRVHMWIYYRTERPDLDESLILDCLQGIVYKNDRQVREKHVYHAIDKDDPRAYVEIEKIQTTAVTPNMVRPGHG